MNSNKLATVVLACAAAWTGSVQAQTVAGADSTSATAPGAGAPLAALKDKISYATGVMTARQLTRNDVAFDLDLMIQGLKDGLADREIRMSEKELKLVLQSMSADIQRKLTNERNVQASVNREHGLAYQEAYKKKPDVTVLPGNLMYRVIKAGNGDKPSELGKVVVRYQGRRVDGQEFDATPEGKTATIKLSEVITGWKEALKRMPAGSTWEIVVPPTMAYATRGAGSIGPNETLVFNVELVAVVQ